MDTRPCHQQELQVVALLSSYSRGSRSPSKKTKKQGAAGHPLGGGEATFSLTGPCAAGSTDWERPLPGALAGDMVKTMADL